MLCSNLWNSLSVFSNFLTFERKQFIDTLPSRKYFIKAVKCTLAPLSNTSHVFFFLLMLTAYCITFKEKKTKHQLLHGWVKRGMDVLPKWRHKLLPCMFPCMACHKNQFVTSNQELSGALLTPSWNKWCFVFYKIWCLWKVNISRKKKEKRRKALWEVQASTLEENYLRLCTLSHLTEKTFSIPEQHASTEVNKPWAWMANKALAWFCTLRGNEWL